MEIEIGESLALSYLKHVKKCVIYQTNWKLSSWWLQELGKKSPAENLYDQLKKSPSKEKTAATDFDVKDVLTSDFSQFLKQAEIDVLGVDKDGNVYAIDVAFHEGGLGYGKKVDARDRVMKKFVRSYMIMLGCFPGKKCTVIFASPKVDAAKQDLIMPALEELQADARFKDNGITFEYIANDKFKAEILDQTIEASRNDADTNELFLRSYKLLNLPYTEAKSTKKKASSSASSSLETGS
ncbi:MAG: hypothetical protein HXN20_03100 [Porphyromonas sp.]|uniref:hypothetical protein n=1 Tax=Porphyromonas sp. TaxID=1924944 RepID=UPI001CB4AFEE|nr:hypothetical protein [Porphyromonas sp.]MBF1413031.1 hypothetical protein [Porphyromonas sp.]